MSMPKKDWTEIYLVIGDTGAHEDYAEWPVVAYGREEEAQGHIVRATARAKEIAATRTSQYSAPKDVLNEHDPGMLMDSNGTNYRMVKVELRMTHMRYLGALKLLEECSPSVSEDLRESIQCAMDDAVAASGGRLQTSRILNRIRIDVVASFVEP